MFSCYQNQRVYRIASVTAVVVSALVLLWQLATADNVSADLELAGYRDGSYRVGVDIEPGIYIADDISGICHVRFTDVDGQLRGLSFVGRAILKVGESDAEFTSDGCGEWVSRYGVRSAGLATEFGAGTYEVGVDIEPGYYLASSDGGRCFWFTLEDFSYDSEDSRLLNVWRLGNPVAKISDGMAGFYSARCGRWSKLPDAGSDAPATEFGDGSYLVGVHVQPGSYTSTSVDGGSCTWMRTAPFTPESGDVTGGYTSEGNQIVTILDSDSGFYSSGCGQWRLMTENVAMAAVVSDTIGAGTYAVGMHIEPGLYTASGTDGEYCSWEVLSGFTGRDQDVLSSGVGLLRGIVEITVDTVGFRSKSCEEWEQVTFDDSGNAGADARFGDGEFVVGVHVAPGVYVAPGAQSGRCLWKRLGGFTGSDDEVLAVHNVAGRVIAQIEGGDAGFQSYGCGQWRRFSFSGDSELIVEFGTGRWAVGVEVAFGTYSAEIPSGSQCFWSRYSGFAGELADLVSSDSTRNHAVMTISNADVAVYSDGCGAWIHTGYLSAGDARDEFSEGVYMVGTDILPGTYVAANSSTDECYWSRLNGFRSDSFDRLSAYAGRGPAVATVMDSDAGFRSWNCGTWMPIDSAVVSDSDLQIAGAGDVFGDGTFLVGMDMAPGSYEGNLRGNALCRWRRVSDFSWNTGVITEVTSSERTIATILPSDKGFFSYRCGEWHPIDINNIESHDAESADDDATTPAGPSMVIGEGAFVVGVDIMPGTYVSEPWPTRRCGWSRLSGFTHDDAGLIAEGESTGQQIVTIRATDVGFVTNDCRDWVMLSDSRSAADDDIDSESVVSSLTTSFGDGVYQVGIDIMSGKYVADVGDVMYVDGGFVPACRWERLSGFTHESSDVIVSGFARGHHVAVIGSGDVGFLSENCGQWEMVATDMDGYK